jgi:hypothetical protein
MEWWRRPFLFPSWVRWRGKLVQLVVLPLVWLYDAGLIVLFGPSTVRIILSAAMTGVLLCSIDVNSSCWALDRRMKHRLGDDW